MNDTAAKSADAFRTISEVADELDVPQHVLRFWEGKFAQIKPLKRGGGRRYYRPDDVDLLRGIRRLLHVDGYTIKGVQKVFRDQGARMVLDLGRGTILRIDTGDAARAGAAEADQSPAAPGPAARTGGDHSPSAGNGNAGSHNDPDHGAAVPLVLSAQSRAGLERALNALEGARAALGRIARGAHVSPKTVIE